MGNHLLKVTLNSKGDLDVADGGKLEVSPSTAVQLVVWSLSGPGLKDAEFGGPDPGDLGFTWVTTNNGVFSGAMRGARKRRLFLEDDHWGLATKGGYVYLLRVRIPGKNGAADTYASTTHTRISKTGVRMTENPIIINR